MTKLGNWIQVISNFAVLVGLIFVGYQLLQDRELKRNEMLDQGWELNLARVYQIMGEDIGEVIAKSAIAPNELTYGEQYRLIVYFDSVILQNRRDAMLERIGMRPVEWRRKDIPTAFKTELGKKHLERLLSQPEDDSLDWSIPSEVRQRWAAEIADPSFPEQLRRFLKAAEVSISGLDQDHQ